MIEALEGGRRRVHEILDATGSKEVSSKAAARGVRVQRVPKGRVEELAPGTAHQGVAARVEP